MAASRLGARWCVGGDRLVTTRTSAGPSVCPAEAGRDRSRPPLDWMIFCGSFLGYSLLDKLSSTFE